MSALCQKQTSRSAREALGASAAKRRELLPKPQSEVGLIVQPGAKDVVSETRVRGYLPPVVPVFNLSMTEGRKIRYFAMFQSLWALPKVEKRSYLPLYDLKPNTTLVTRLSGIHPAGERTRAAS